MFTYKKKKKNITITCIGFKPYVQNSNTVWNFCQCESPYM